MMKRTQLILLFMLVLSGAVLLGTIPAGAQGTTNITGVRVDDGAVVTDLSGQMPINPCYNPTPTVIGSPCYPMVEATDLWICNGDPMSEGALEPDLTHCRQFNYSTFGVAYNVWTVIGGIVTWVNLPCSATIKCVPPKICKLSTGKCILP